MADSRQVLEYQYDGAGNIIAIRSDVGTAPPAIQAVNPATIHLDQTLTIVATGTNVRNAEVSTEQLGLTVSNVVSTNNTVEFELSADNLVPLGEQTITFSTTLGTGTASIVVLPALLDLIVDPSPIAVNNLGEPVTLTIGIQNPAVTDIVLSLSIADDSMATLSASSLTIPTGQTQTTETVTVTGGSTLGNTSLQITSEVTDFDTPVYITEPYDPEPGDYQAFSTLLGIEKEVAPLSQTSELLITGSLLGIEKEVAPSSQTSELLITGSLLGIEKEFSVPSQTSELLITGSLLGIEKEVPASSQTSELLITGSLLGVSAGGQATQLSPSLIPGNQITRLIINGQSLQPVTSLVIEPTDGITQTGSLEIATDGTQLSVDLDVAETAALSSRQVSLFAGAVEIPFTDPGNAVIEIMGDLPIISSLEPTQELAGTTFTLTINGINLSDASSISATPATDVSIGRPTVNAEGTQITVEISIDANASLGSRIISVTTPAGAGSSTASSTNSFNIN